MTKQHCLEPWIRECSMWTELMHLHPQDIIVLSWMYILNVGLFG